MRNQVFNYFDIAAKFAVSKVDERSFLLGALGERNDGTLVSAINLPSELPNRMAHAEYRLSKKLDYGAIVYVVRIRLMDGSFGMSRPCKNCQKVLIHKKVKKVYYTINQFEAGCWDVIKNTDTYFSR